ncbi:hypothetical protein BJ875DRAFT_83201 [Amylocarpus encephaloides]|uniref:Uncharacterized protein n=1 Tax=Amylocarpus encephaloides TaxID=45428 RepID=A0A9P7YTV5_9HELO|nr:hypothetical protein BJ875DRAFT_83201 [Amylocarpus encephaloides]
MINASLSPLGLSRLSSLSSPSIPLYLSSPLLLSSPHRLLLLSKVATDSVCYSPHKQPNYHPIVPLLLRRLTQTQITKRPAASTNFSRNPPSPDFLHIGKVSPPRRSSNANHPYHIEMPSQVSTPVAHPIPRRRSPLLANPPDLNLSLSASLNSKAKSPYTFVSRMDENDYHPPAAPPPSPVHYPSDSWSTACRR